MSKTKIFLLIILHLFLTQCENKKSKNYIYNGKNININFVSNKSDLINGFGGDSYENGNLKSLAYFENGKIVDTLFYYYKNGLVKEKGLLKNKMSNGWWFKYDKNGNLKEKIEFLQLGDTLYKNQRYFYNKKGEILIEPSTFFELEIPDTLILGRNVGIVKSYVTNFNNRTGNLISIIIDNQYSETKIVKDTFGDNTLNPFFGIYGYRIGKQTIKGKIKETILTKTVFNKDSASLLIEYHYKYFERNVYVWNKKERSIMGEEIYNKVFEKEKTNHNNQYKQ